MKTDLAPKNFFFALLKVFFLRRRVCQTVAKRIGGRGGRGQDRRIPRQAGHRQHAGPGHQEGDPQAEEGSGREKEDCAQGQPAHGWRPGRLQRGRANCLKSGQMI